MNTAIGYQVLVNSSGTHNTATGHSAMSSDTTGASNAAYGYNALASNLTGNGDTAVGYGALDAQMSGDFNIGIGLFAGNGVITAGNVICIGASGADVNDSCYIGNIWTQPGGSQAVYVNSDGKLGAQVSSRRFKEDIHPMEEASATLYRLKPVSFRYKKEIDRRGTQQLGLVAEEVAVVNPDLVIRDKEGKPYSVRYDQVNAMLLNEFFKEHQKVEQQAREMQNEKATIVELKSTVAQQQKAMETVTTQLKEQAAQIQKVSAQIEASKAALQVVNNNP
jgi:trimeric autotransporter adhesin